ncbi:MAG: hypothetical protein Q7K57_27135 [Burkholderiaceae bacterium]|nr:hypothetical protein [Burkholderiaceae bacterium]
MPKSRIPQLTGTSKNAALAWLTALHHGGMLFCLDDDPRDILKISDDSRLFTDGEAAEISGILNRLFTKRGDELHDLAFEVLSRTFHTKEERKAFKTLND